jgi:hypothetical protein
LGLVVQRHYHRSEHQSIGLQCTCTIVYFHYIVSELEVGLYAFGKRASVGGEVRGDQRALRQISETELKLDLNRHLVLEKDMYRKR